MWHFDWGMFWSVLAALAVWGVFTAIVKMIVVEFSSK